MPVAQSNILLYLTVPIFNYLFTKWVRIGNSMKVCSVTRNFCAGCVIGLNTLSKNPQRIRCVFR